VRAAGYRLDMRCLVLVGTTLDVLPYPRTGVADREATGSNVVSGRVEYGWFAAEEKDMFNFCVNFVLTFFISRCTLLFNDNLTALRCMDHPTYCCWGRCSYMVSARQTDPAPCGYSRRLPTLLHGPRTLGTLRDCCTPGLGVHTLRILIR
jgi:hypothetical protein